MNGSLLALGAASALALGAVAFPRGSRGLRWRMTGRAPSGITGRTIDVNETVETVLLPSRAEFWGFPAGREATSTISDMRRWGGFDFAPIGVDEDEATARVEHVYPVGTLLHIRERVEGREHPNLVLTPRIPKTPLPGEDRHTPRVSLAPRLGGALWGIGFHTKVVRESNPWDVYANTESVHGVVPSFLDVPDKDESGEVWSLAPVPVARIGTLSLDAIWRATGVLSELAFRKYKNRRTPWTPTIQKRVWTAAEVAAGWHA